MTKPLRLTIAYMYPREMTLYGDLGNVVCLLQRCRWRGIEAEVREIGMGEGADLKANDIFLMGGGADSGQRLVANDLRESKGSAIREAVEDGAAALLVCGAYQLWGHYYRPAQGNDLPGLGIFNAYTEHSAARERGLLAGLGSAGRGRASGNIVVRWKDRTLVGFENHGGRTYLMPGAQPLGKLLAGKGNNGEDGWEGCIYKNAIGTYLHGPVLPKNPHLADHLISAALRRRYGEPDLEPLDDALEWEAHRRAVEQATAGNGWRKRLPAWNGRSILPKRQRP